MPSKMNAIKLLGIKKLAMFVLSLEEGTTAGALLQRIYSILLHTLVSTTESDGILPVTTHLQKPSNKAFQSRIPTIEVTKPLDSLHYLIKTITTL